MFISFFEKKKRSRAEGLNNDPFYPSPVANRAVDKFHNSFPIGIILILGVPVTILTGFASRINRLSKVSDKKTDTPQSE